MAVLQVRLFGDFSVRRNERELPGFEGNKVRELFAYLLLKQRRPHGREALAGMLWGDAPAAQARKYLRQALWQLQGALQACVASDGPPVLITGADQVRLNDAADLWIDVVAFERGCAAGRVIPSGRLTDDQVIALRSAVDLYGGELLDGWYVDWCLVERERLQFLYLGALDALMGHCESCRDYETGLRYGTSILRVDRASERTHRRLMRLHYLAGDRTAALRQFARCVAALESDLGVAPAGSTMRLYDQIRADCLETATPDTRRPTERGAASSDDLSHRLAQLDRRLAAIERQLAQVARVTEPTRSIVADEHRPMIAR